MGDRGRTPASALNVVDSGIVSVKRPRPPEELTPAQAEEWRAVVERLPADWFPRETHAMLSEYCKHVITARTLGKMIARIEDPAFSEPVEGESEFNMEAYDDLLKMRERESRTIMALSRSMRMTQQATYDPKRKKGKAGAKPWESAA